MSLEINREELNRLVDMIMSSDKEISALGRKCLIKTDFYNKFAYFIVDGLYFYSYIIGYNTIYVHPKYYSLKEIVNYVFSVYLESKNHESN